MEKARRYIELVLNVEDLRKDAGSVATNPIIQAYVKEKYGFYVHSLYIAQVRDKLGIKLHESANKVEQPKRKVSICPAYKEAAIMDARSSIMSSIRHNSISASVIEAAVFIKD